MVELIWSPRSLKDLELIFEYIKQDSIEMARAFVNELIQTATTIPEFPYSGRLVPEFNRDNIREKIYQSYRIIYRIRGQEVELITCLHQARRLIRKEFK
ncbi:type II toxin-antitoxin system RelE/ParE family toxin [Cohnella silvisoli]|uniref:Type II toxin-antitoxin system RelE/ParE family toxin n=1 Tax=Cohnella silvisoli TaxID=2873699 RepID=A0ABV1KVI9_9BACL|nr:type II toxin-antitoxin system RelE/ParE family toxin [Cohnella silvisoli]MCD9023462.1 type II toxin-antitoxin system RelE/ParE family toxin [Cohnella silvisoli]